ncbi:hypothetical protein [Microcoleus sp.]|uniref:hypothetical protein n=1 Tax=Microcoleus sp. TaxID=44472 RepID=UPI003593B623
MICKLPPRQFPHRIVIDSPPLTGRIKLIAVLVRSSITAKDLFKGRNSLVQAVAIARNHFDLDAGGLTSLDGCDRNS